MATFEEVMFTVIMVPQSHRKTEQSKVEALARSILDIDIIAGPQNARRYLGYVRQHGLPDTPIVMLSQQKGKN